MRWLVTPAVLLAVLVPASRAQANEVNLWFCHGPSGQALGTPALFSGWAYTGTLTGSCETPGSSLSAGMIQVNLPGGVPLTGVRLDRKATGPGYVASTLGGGVLERLDDASTFDGWSAFSANGTANTGDGVKMAGGTF